MNEEDEPEPDVPPVSRERTPVGVFRIGLPEGVVREFGCRVPVRAVGLPDLIGGALRTGGELGGLLVGGLIGGGAGRDIGGGVGRGIGSGARGIGA